MVAAKSVIIDPFLVHFGDDLTSAIDTEGNRLRVRRPWLKDDRSRCSSVEKTSRT